MVLEVSQVNNDRHRNPAPPRESAPRFGSLGGKALSIAIMAEP